MAGINSNTVLMLHMNGTDGSTSFPDDSPLNHTVTAVGDAQVDTAQSVFGGASLLCDGAGDYLTVPDHDCWDFGTGEWTIDMRFRINAFITAYWAHLLDIGNGYSGNGVRILGYPTQLRIVIGGTSYDYYPTINLATWYYLKVGRSGNYLKVYLDESQLGSDTDITGTDITGTTTGVYVGDAPNNGAGNETELNGWVDELRIQKGEWDGTFATEEYSADTRRAAIPIFW